MPGGVRHRELDETVEVSWESALALNSRLP